MADDITSKGWGGKFIDWLFPSKPAETGEHDKYQLYKTAIETGNSTPEIERFVESYEERGGNWSTPATGESPIISEEDTGGGGGGGIGSFIDTVPDVKNMLLNLAKIYGKNRAIQIATSQYGIPVNTALWALNTPIGQGIKQDFSRMIGNFIPKGSGYAAPINNQGIMDKLIRQGAAESMKRAGVDLSGRQITSPSAPTQPVSGPHERYIPSPPVSGPHERYVPSPPVSGPHGGGGQGGPSEAQQRFERSGADENRGFTRTKKYGKAYQRGGIVSLMDLLNRRI